MSKKQISARVDISVYKYITDIEVSTGAKKSTIIEDLLTKAIRGNTHAPKTTYTQPPTPKGTTEAAREIATEQLRYKKELEECKSRNENLVKTLNTSKPLQALLNHPLAKKVQSETIVTTPDGKELKVSSLHQLLDFINEYVWVD